MNEISSLEYKIIWELETWKKAEVELNEKAMILNIL